MYCRYLDRTDPYLKLGPFKYETLNDLPHIAVIRDFASKKQTQLVQDQVKKYYIIILFFFQFIIRV